MSYPELFGVPFDGIIAFLLRSLILISCSMCVLWIRSSMVGDHEMGKVDCVPLEIGHSKFLEACTVKENVGKCTRIC